MVSVDGSLIVQIVNFLFLIWMLNMILYKPIRGILAKRKGKVLDLEKGIRDSSRLLDDKEDAYANGIKGARLAGQKKKESLINSAVSEKSRIIEEINAKAKVDLDKSRAKIRSEFDGVFHTLGGEVDAFAKAIGQKILGRSL